MIITGLNPETSEVVDVIRATTPDPGEQLLEELFPLRIALSGESDLYSRLERILTRARWFTEAEAATLYLREGSHLRFAVVQNDMMARRLGEDAMRQRLEDARLPLDVPSLASHVALTGAVLNVPDAYAIPPGRPYAFNWRADAVTRYRTRSVLTVPLRDTSPRILGVLQLINAVGATGQVIPFHPGLEDVACVFAACATAAIRAARRGELSLRDRLTDSYSRHYFMLRLDEEVNRSARSNDPLSLVLLGLDRFTIVNDRWGREAGDEVLKQVVQLLAGQSLDSTVVARYGGDEFVALLPSTPKAAAIGHAECLRSIIARCPFMHGPVTASFGVACLPDDTGNGAGLISGAADALYEAKRQGRNVVRTP